MGIHGVGKTDGEDSIFRHGRLGFLDWWRFWWRRLIQLGDSRYCDSYSPSPHQLRNRSPNYNGELFRERTLHIRQAPHQEPVAAGLRKVHERVLLRPDIAPENRERIVGNVSTLLTDETAYARMARKVFVYGDGLAAQRITEVLVDGRLTTPEFDPEHFA